MASKQTPRNNLEKFLRIRVLSHTGDKIHIKLPVNFAKRMIENNALDLFNGKDDVVDGKKVTEILVKAFDYDLTGEVVHLERKNGDIIKVSIMQ